MTVVESNLISSSAQLFYVCGTSQTNDVLCTSLMHVKCQCSSEVKQHCYGSVMRFVYVGGQSYIHLIIFAVTLL